MSRFGIGRRAARYLYYRIALKEYSVTYEAKKEAEKILKETRDMLSESINEKCRRLTLEDEYRKIISDPYIQEYLEYKKCIGSHNLDREQEIDYREIDIGDMD